MPSATLEILIKARDLASGELRALQREIKNNEKAFNTAGLALAGIGAAGVAGFGLAVKSAIDFESSFAGVRKTVDATEEQFAALEDGFRSMARQTPINVNEINRIGEAAGQLGIQVENIESFTKTMADLGVSTNMSSDQAATALARLANITQMPETEFDRLGSTVVALGNNLATTEGEIVDFALRVAGAGKQVGLSEAEILGFAGALSSVGIAADAGGTAISRVMIEIAKSVRSGGARLEEFARVAGMSVDEFRAAFQEDAAGAIVAFVEGLGRMSDAGENVFGVLESVELQDIRVRDALLRAAGAGDVLREALDLGTAAWEENTALTEEAEKRYGTMASQIDILQNNINDMAIEIGEQLVPMLAGATGAATDVLEVWRKLPEPIKETTVRLGAATSGTALFAGALLLALPRIASAAAAFRTLWQSSMLFRGSLIGGAGLIAAVTVLPPVIDLVRQSFDTSADATRRQEEAAKGLRDELDKLPDNIDRASAASALFRGEVDDLAGAYQELAGTNFDLGPLQDALKGLTDAGREAGMTGTAMTAILQEAGIPAKLYTAALADLMVKELGIIPAEQLFSYALAQSAAAAEEAAASTGGLSDELASLGQKIVQSLQPNAELAQLIDDVAGARTEDARLLDVQTNALEQQRVAMELARPAFEAQIAAFEAQKQAIQNNMQPIQANIAAIDLEVSRLNLQRDALQAQIDARNQLAALTLEQARIASLPDMVRQKQLELDREKILQAVGGNTEALTEAQKKQLAAIDDELKSLQTNINVKRLEAELTNLQSEAKDDHRRVIEDEIRAIQDSVSALQIQRGELNLQLQPYQDSVAAIDGQIGSLQNQVAAYDASVGAIQREIDNLGLQREAIDLVTEGWKLQAEAMLGLPGLEKLRGAFESLKNMMFLLLGEQLAAATRAGDIAEQERLAAIFEQTRHMHFSAQHGAFVPPGVVAAGVLHGGQHGEVITPLDRLPAGGRPVELHVHFHDRPGATRRQARDIARDVRDQIERDRLYEFIP